MTTPTTKPRVPVVPLVIGAGVLALFAAGAALFLRARGETNQVALSSLPKGVTAVPAVAATWRSSRRYVGTLEPWVSASIGPQLISAYVDSVLVRPGASVRRGQVLATLDCKTAAATNKAVVEQAHALQTMQAAISKEAGRVATLLAGGYASPDEVENKQADAASKQAQLLALEAQAAGASLQVKDCILRAPFDGEIADREKDPGAFVRPGEAIATLVDRTMVRVVADVPEDDFASVAPRTVVKLRILATGQELAAVVSRRAPAADPSTRTVHIEVDLANAARTIPVGTTAELLVDVGEPSPAVAVPLSAASVRGTKATLFSVDGEVAHVRVARVRGEREGILYLEPSLAAGTLVVTEGSGALAEGDRVSAKVDAGGAGDAVAHGKHETSTSELRP